VAAFSYVIRSIGVGLGPLYVSPFLVYLGQLHGSVLGNSVGSTTRNCLLSLLLPLAHWLRLYCLYLLLFTGPPNLISHELFCFPSVVKWSHYTLMSSVK